MSLCPLIDFPLSKCPEWRSGINSGRWQKMLTKHIVWRGNVTTEVLLNVHLMEYIKTHTRGNDINSE